MFKVVIVEDEQPTLDLMNIVINRNSSFTITGAFTNPLEALERLPELKPDVVFLDVEMPRMSGLELAHQLVQLLEHTHLVFTTAYKQYALEAFDVHALDYIVKPVTPKAIERVRERLMKQPPLASKEDARHNISTGIRCFGGFEVRNAQGKLVSYPTRKTEELFAYLLCHPHQNINKWQLAELLWPDKDGGRALHNLYNTIHRLKKTLASHEMGMEIQKTSEGYLLNTGKLLYDVPAFQKVSGALDDEIYVKALAEQLFSLYRGALLDVKPYVWKLALEEKFRKCYDGLVRRLVRNDLAKGERDKAEQRLHACLAIDPLHAEMHMLLLDLYAESGSKEKMMDHYRRLEVMYRERLDTDPPQELRSKVASCLA